MNVDENELRYSLGWALRCAGMPAEKCKDGVVAVLDLLRAAGVLGGES